MHHHQIYADESLNEVSTKKPFQRVFEMAFEIVVYKNQDLLKIRPPPAKYFDQ